MSGSEVLLKVSTVLDALARDLTAQAAQSDRPAHMTSVRVRMPAMGNPAVTPKQINGCRRDHRQGGIGDLSFHVGWVRQPVAVDDRIVVSEMGEQ